MTDPKKLSARSIAADCYDLLAIPEARSTISGLARRAHELNTGDEESPPLIDRPVDRNHPQECAAWCIGLVRYFHRDWEHFPQLYEPAEEIGTGPSESARVSVAVFDSYVDDWLSARPDLCRVLPAVEHEDGSTSAEVDPSMLAVQGYWLLPERLRQNANALLSVLRARLDEWGSQFDIAAESPQSNDQADDTHDRGRSANDDAVLGECTFDVAKQIVLAGRKSTKAQVIDEGMQKMLRVDPSCIE